MIEIVTAALAALSLAAGEPDMTGFASRYNEGVFERVIEWRIATGCHEPSPRCHGYSPLDWRDYDGWLATLDCSDVGKTVWARPGEGHVWERFLVADCLGHASSLDWFHSNNIIVELDYQSYMRWKAAGYYTSRGLTAEIVEVSG